MINSNYSTIKNVAIPVQRSMFGPAKYLGDTTQKLTALYHNKPKVFDKEKEVIFAYWITLEGLSDIVGDKLSALKWWFQKATSPETITRCLRGIRENKTIQQSPEQMKKRNERQDQYRQFWGAEARRREP